jgi:hypothetical protein
MVTAQAPPLVSHRPKMIMPVGSESGCFLHFQVGPSRCYDAASSHSGWHAHGPCQRGTHWKCHPLAGAFMGVSIRRLGRARGVGPGGWGRLRTAADCQWPTPSRSHLWRYAAVRVRGAGRGPGDAACVESIVIDCAALNGTRPNKHVNSPVLVGVSSRLQPPRAYCKVRKVLCRAWDRLPTICLLVGSFGGLQAPLGMKHWVGCIAAGMFFESKPEVSRRHIRVLRREINELILPSGRILSAYTLQISDTNLQVL